eukprot:TRINITY_DN28166_c0_g1_i1.p1 TRINITY_DN28166_c0_g1~~TRINITY_DN28166_c0_g1_i1.p1  ORF type:complete len:4097 (-),score=857.75 TRINITY_DN28166_c0_g1_i1:144-12434(-)
MARGTHRFQTVSMTIIVILYITLYGIDVVDGQVACGNVVCHANATCIDSGSDHCQCRADLGLDGDGVNVCTDDGCMGAVDSETLEEGACSTCIGYAKAGGPAGTCAWCQLDGFPLCGYAAQQNFTASCSQLGGQLVTSSSPGGTCQALAASTVANRCSFISGEDCASCINTGCHVCYNSVSQRSRCISNDTRLIDILCDEDEGGHLLTTCPTASCTSNNDCIGQGKVCLLGNCTCPENQEPSQDGGCTRPLDEDDDPQCGPITCHPQAECISSSASNPTCQCWEGYSGNGTVCSLLSKQLITKNSTNNGDDSDISDVYTLEANPVEESEDFRILAPQYGNLTVTITSLQLEPGVSKVIISDKPEPGSDSAPLATLTGGETLPYTVTTQRTMVAVVKHALGTIQRSQRARANSFKASVLARGSRGNTFGSTCPRDEYVASGNATEFQLTSWAKDSCREMLLRSVNGTGLVVGILPVDIGDEDILSVYEGDSINETRRVHVQSGPSSAPLAFETTVPSLLLHLFTASPPGQRKGISGTFITNQQMSDLEEQVNKEAAQLEAGRYCSKRQRYNVSADDSGDALAEYQLDNGELEGVDVLPCQEWLIQPTSDFSTVAVWIQNVILRVGDTLRVYADALDGSTPTLLKQYAHGNTPDAQEVHTLTQGGIVVVLNATAYQAHDHPNVTQLTLSSEPRVPVYNLTGCDNVVHMQAGPSTNASLIFNPVTPYENNTCLQWTVTIEEPDLFTELIVAVNALNTEEDKDVLHIFKGNTTDKANLITTLSGQQGGVAPASTVNVSNITSVNDTVAADTVNSTFVNDIKARLEAKYGTSDPDQLPPQAFAEAKGEMEGLAAAANVTGTPGETSVFGNDKAVNGTELITVKEGVVTVLFKSDAQFRGAGFRLVVTANRPQSEECQSFNVSGSTGTIASSPQPYPNDHCQVWYIEAPNPSDRLEFEFTQLGLAPPGDVVTIYDGYSKNDTMLGQFTNYTLPSSSVVSWGNKMRVEFSADSLGMGVGFAGTYRVAQTQPRGAVCANRTVYSDRSIGEVRHIWRDTTSNESMYDSDECKEWTVKLPTGNSGKMIIQVAAYDLDEGDVVTIVRGERPRRAEDGTFPGFPKPMDPDMYPAPYNDIVRNTFPEAVGLVPDRPTMTESGFLQYGKEETKGFPGINAEVLKNMTWPAPFVANYTGRSASRRAGAHNDRIVVEASDVMFLFESDSTRNARGFLFYYMDWTASGCYEQSITGISGTLKLPTPQYFENWCYIWKIKMTGSKPVMRLTFESFQTEADADYVVVYDAANADDRDKVLANITGDSLPSTGDLYTTGKDMYIELRTDPSWHPRQAGFVAKVVESGPWAPAPRLKGQLCARDYLVEEAPSRTVFAHRLTQDNITKISTYPRPYAPSSCQEWQVVSNDTLSRVIFYAQGIETEKHYDRVKLYDGKTQYAKLLGDFSGTHAAGSIPPITSSGPAMLIVFSSDDGDEKPLSGMQADLHIVPMCHRAHLVKDSGSLSDGLQQDTVFPADGSGCVQYTIETPGHRSVSLSITSLSLTGNSSAYVPAFDFLRIYQGTNTSAPVLYELAGPELGQALSFPINLVSATPGVLIVFRTTDPATPRALQGTFVGQSNCPAAGTITWYQDQDGDLSGTPTSTTSSCTRPSPTHVSRAGDCNDGNATFHERTEWYPDSDGDGYGDVGSSPVVQCSRPVHLTYPHVLDNTDCSPQNARVHPTTKWYPDTDGDGHGVPQGYIVNCTRPAGNGTVVYVLDHDDQCPDEKLFTAPRSCGCAVQCLGGPCCDAKTKCFAPASTACDDGNACTASDTCVDSMGTCTGALKPACNCTTYDQSTCLAEHASCSWSSSSSSCHSATHCTKLSQLSCISDVRCTYNYEVKRCYDRCAQYDSIGECAQDDTQRQRDALPAAVVMAKLPSAGECVWHANTTRCVYQNATKLGLVCVDDNEPDCFLGGILSSLNKTDLVPYVSGFGTQGVRLSWGALSPGHIASGQVHSILVEVTKHNSYAQPSLVQTFTVPAAKSSAIIAPLIPKTLYYARLRLQGLEGITPPGANTSFVTLPAQSHRVPDPPTNVSAVALGHRAFRVHWISNVARDDIYQHTVYCQVGELTALHGSDVLSLAVATPEMEVEFSEYVQQDKTYRCAVEAYNMDGHSPLANVTVTLVPSGSSAQANLPAVPTTAPTLLTNRAKSVRVQVPTPAKGTSSSARGAVTHVKVEAVPSSGGTPVIVTEPVSSNNSTVMVIVRTLSPSTTYNVTYKTVNAQGDSPQSSPVLTVATSAPVTSLANVALHLEVVDYSGTYLEVNVSTSTTVQADTNSQYLHAQVQLSTALDFATIARFSEPSDLSQNRTFAFGGLRSDRTYYARARVADDDGVTSDWNTVYGVRPAAECHCPPGTVCRAGDCLPACDTVSDCDDGNPCVNKTCSFGACYFANNTLPCDDGVFCNGLDTCSNGTCQVHAGDPCLGNLFCNNTCNELNDTCARPAATDCDSDGNQCTSATCDGLGTCNVLALDRKPCDDGSNCTISDFCDGSTCSGGKFVCNCTQDTDCFDRIGLNCTVSTCSNTTAQCQYNNVTCSQGQICPAGIVSALGPTTNATDLCLPEYGCTCGGCRTDANCDDGNSCTKDTCNGDGVCSNVYNATLCGCVSDANCTSSNPCQNATCNPSTGQCQLKTLPDGQVCDDGAWCTINDRCLSGSCTGSPRLNCSDTFCGINGICDNNQQRCVYSQRPDRNGAVCGTNTVCQTVFSTPAVCNGGYCHSAPDCNTVSSCCDGKCNIGATTKVCQAAACSSAGDAYSSGVCGAAGKCVVTSIPCAHGCSASSGCLPAPKTVSFVPAPKCAVLLSSFAELVLTFTYPTNQPACERVLADSSLVRLGAPFRCFWRSAQEVVYELGFNTTAKVATSLQLRPGHIFGQPTNVVGANTDPNAAWNVTSILTLTDAKVTACGVTQTSSSSTGTSTTGGSTSSQTATALALSLVGPSLIGSCGSVVLHASMAESSRLTSAQWSISGGTATAALLQALKTASSDNSLVVSFDAQILNTGTTTISLVVQNAAGITNTTSHAILKEQSSVPVVSVTSTYIKTSAAQGLALRVTGQLPCGANPSAGDMTYAWTSSLPDLLINSGTRIAGPELTVGPSVLTPGTTFTLTVVGTVQGTQRSAPAAITIEVARSPLLAVIKNGNSQVTGSGTLTLDGSLSTDPDKAPLSLQYEWTCHLSNNAAASCLTSNSPPRAPVASSANVEIAGETLVSGKLTFTLKVSKNDGRTASATVEVERVAGTQSQFMSILWSSDTRIHLPGHTLQLTAYITTGKKRTLAPVTWTESGGLLNLADKTIRKTAVNHQSALVLRKNILQVGLEYNFAASAVVNNVTLRASIRVPVARRPFGGSVDVFPNTNIVAGQTSVNIQVHSWVDPTASATGFEYSYTYVSWASRKVKEVALTNDRWVKNSVLSTILPPGDPANGDALTLRIKLRASGVESLPFDVTLVSLNPIQTQQSRALSASQIKTQYQDCVKRARATRDRALLHQCGLTAMNMLKSQKQKLQRLARIAILAATPTPAATASSSTNTTQDEASAVTDLVNTIVQTHMDALSDPEHRASDAYLNKEIAIHDQLLETSGTMAVPQAKSLQGLSMAMNASRDVALEDETILSAISAIDTALDLNPSCELTADFVAQLEILLRKQMSGTLPGEEGVQFTGTSLRVGRFTDHVVNIDKSTACAFANVTVDPAAFTRYGSEAVIEQSCVRISVDQHRCRTSGPSIKSHVLDLSYTAGTVPVTQGTFEFNVDLLSGVTTSNTTSKCEYYDTSKAVWSPQGCETVSAGPASLRCRCDHLTEFAAVERQSSDSSFSLIPLVPIAAGVVVLAIAAAIGVTVFRRRQRVDDSKGKKKYAARASGTSGGHATARHYDSASSTSYASSSYASTSSATTTTSDSYDSSSGATSTTTSDSLATASTTADSSSATADSSSASVSDDTSALSSDVAASSSSAAASSTSQVQSSSAESVESLVESSQSSSHLSVDMASASSTVEDNSASSSRNEDHSSTSAGTVDVMDDEDVTESDSSVPQSSTDTSATGVTDASSVMGITDDESRQSVDLDVRSDDIGP